MSDFNLSDLQTYGSYWIVVSVDTKISRIDNGYDGHTETFKYPKIQVFLQEMELRDWIRFHSTELTKYRILKCQPVTPQIEVKVNL